MKSLLLIGENSPAHHEQNAHGWLWLASLVWQHWHEAKTQFASSCETIRIFPSHRSRLLYSKPDLFIFQSRAIYCSWEMLGKSIEQCVKNVNISSKVGSKTITSCMIHASNSESDISFVQRQLIFILITMNNSLHSIMAYLLNIIIRCDRF